MKYTHVLITQLDFSNPAITTLVHEFNITKQFQEDADKSRHNFECNLGRFRNGLKDSGV
jgi:hypothetical protein